MDESIYDNPMDEGYSEDELAELAQLGIIPDKNDLLAQQLAQAAQLRRQESYDSPQGRQTGGVYTAAHPLEFAAQVLRHYKDQGSLDKVFGEQKAGLEDAAKKRHNFMSRHYGKKPMIPDGFSWDSIEAPTTPDY